MSGNEEMHLDNSGKNSGLIIGQNVGTVNFSISEAVKLPFHITKIVKELAAACPEIDDLVNKSELRSFDVEDKISHNSVIKYREIVMQYVTYSTICDNILNTYDNLHVGTKHSILRCVWQWYMESKGDLLLKYKEEKKEEIDIIRENADFLFGDVIEKIKTFVRKSDNLIDLAEEDLEFGSVCFICHCFIICKILEKP